MTTEEITKYKDIHTKARQARRDMMDAGKRHDRASMMVRLRYEDGLTLQAIGTRYGLTRERVRQIIDNFLRVQG